MPASQTFAPRTAFSLLYNATSVSSYRREAHEDLRVAFKRFNVTDGEIQETCTRIENASYELRAHSVDADATQADPAVSRKFDAARIELNAATDAFFRQLERELTWFLSSYESLRDNPEYRTSGELSGPEDWLARSQLLLDLLYHCLYVPKFAEAVVAQASSLQKVPVPTKVLEALAFVAATLRGEGRAADAKVHARILCDALAAEYKGTGWRRCW